MIPTVTEKNMQLALEILNAQLEKDQILKRVFRMAALQAHPDKQNGNDEVFKVVKAVSEAFLAVAEKGKKATSAEKLDLSRVLRVLPLDTQTLIIDKILKEQPTLTKKDLLNPVIHRVDTQYEFKANNPLEGRSHAFTVSGENFKGIKDQFKDSKGDFLKSQILNDFRTQIENTGSKEELNDLKKQLQSSPEYAVLKSGQGLFTKITGIQTTSQKTFEAMFSEQEQNLAKVSPAAKAS